MKTSPYRRVPGSAGFWARKRLWFGPDHVLLSTWNLFYEQYRRFYYSDIQAFCIAEIETPARFYGWVLAGITGALVFALALTDHPVWAVLCLIACASLTVFALTRPQVRCELKTLVSTEPLPSIKTRAGARAFLLMLEQEIEKAQGALPGEILAAHPHGGGPVAPPPLHSYSGGMHWAAFGLMLAVAAVTFLRYTLQSPGLANVLAATHLSLMAVTVIAAVKQHGAAINRAARLVIAFTLVWAAASYLTEQVIVATSIQEAFRNPMRFDYWRDPVRDVAVANAIAYVTLGLIGLFALLSEDRRAATQS